MERAAAEQTDLLGRVRIASPCPASWDAMEGDARVRFCRLCALNVYNLSEMTRAEAEALVARTEGRICARLYRRADGTVLTKDCPEGLRAVRRRVRGAAAAVFAAVASLWSVAAGQAPQAKGGQDKQQATLSCEGGGQLKIKRKPVAAGEQPTFSGVAQDPAGAFIPGVSVTLINELTKDEAHAVTSAEGVFFLAHPAPGAYTLRLAAAGFAAQEVQGVAVTADESLSVESVLSLSIIEPFTGIVFINFPAAERNRNGNGKTVFDGDTVRRLPIP
jgi:Carboxypeptidase regulatory-like domain